MSQTQMPPSDVPGEAEMGMAEMPPVDVGAVQPTASFTPPGPVRVDLLPEVYRARIAIAAARRRALFIMLAALVVVVLVALLAFMQVSSAQSARDAAVANEAQAQQQVNAMAEIPRTAAQIAELRTTLGKAMGGEVLFSQVASRIVGAFPAGTTLKTMKLSLAEGTAAKTAAATASVGTVNMDGTVPVFGGGAPLLESLQANPQLANPWVSKESIAGASSATTGATTGAPAATGYDYSADADLSQQALSNRFVTTGAK